MYIHLEPSLPARASEEQSRERASADPLPLWEMGSGRAGISAQMWYRCAAGRETQGEAGWFSPARRWAREAVGGGRSS